MQVKIFFPLLFRFPLKPEALISIDDLDHRKVQLESYLKSVLDSMMFRQHSETVGNEIDL